MIKTNYIKIAQITDLKVNHVKQVLKGKRKAKFRDKIYDFGFKNNGFMKTNVSIKFNSVKEYREIEKKLIELGYKADKKWNETQIKDIQIFNKNMQLYCCVSGPYPLFSIYNFRGYSINQTYNSLQEFLNDNAKTH